PICGRRLLLPSACATRRKEDAIIPRVPRSSLLGTISHTLRIERVRPVFTPLASLSQLDLVKLTRRARAEIELGHLSSGRCRQLVRATVRKGMVTRIDIDSCADRRPRLAPPELRRVIRRAQRMVARRVGPTMDRPIPIATFLPRVARQLIETIMCYKICFYGPWACIYCCTRPQGGLVCGGDVVVTPPIIIDV